MFKRMHGRRKILVDAKEVTRANIDEVMRTAIQIHGLNQSEIEYLYNYYKGVQPVLERVKTVRPEINNHVVINLANEIVAFKVGYLMGEPIQYVLRGDTEKADEVRLLNDYLFSEEVR